MAQPGFGKAKMQLLKARRPGAASFLYAYDAGF